MDTRIVIRHPRKREFFSKLALRGQTAQGVLSETINQYLNQEDIMNITISTKIFSGNLGDGWADNNEAAQGLAEFTRRIWGNDLVEYIEAGHNIEIDIDVIPENISGAGHDVDVHVESDLNGFDQAWELKKDIESSLTDKNWIWDKFCSSEEAKQYFTE